MSRVGSAPMRLRQELDRARLLFSLALRFVRRDISRCLGTVGRVANILRTPRWGIPYVSVPEHAVEFLGIEGTAQ